MGVRSKGLIELKTIFFFFVASPLNDKVKGIFAFFWYHLKRWNMMVRIGRFLEWYGEAVG